MVCSEEETSSLSWLQALYSPVFLLENDLRVLLLIRYYFFLSFFFRIPVLVIDRFYPHEKYRWSILRWKTIFGLRVKTFTSSNLMKILLTVCHSFSAKFVLRIWYWITIYPIIDNFLYSHHLAAWRCFDIVRRNSVLVTSWKWKA